MAPSDSDQFPPTNIPFGIISSTSSTTSSPTPRPATRIANKIIDLSTLTRLGAFDAIPLFDPSTLRDAQTLNAFAAQPRAVRKAVRERVREVWGEIIDDGKGQGKWDEALLEERETRNHVPMMTVNYVDYVSSLGHAVNMADLLNHPIPARAPFHHSPLGYYGNSRNILISGTPVRRFWGPIDGQFQLDRVADVGASKKFDFELELGVYLSGQTAVGQTVKLDEVDDVVFGFVLLNDWSARDIQSSETAGPTGPFLGKSGAVTISPWIVTLDALDDARARLPRQLQPRVPFVDYLSEKDSHGGTPPCLDIRCAVSLRRGCAGDDGEGKERDGEEGVQVCRAEYKQTYWTYRQLLAHQTRNGSAIGPGDLLGTGTMSLFEGDDSGRCCLAERSYMGTRPVELGGGRRPLAWLEDGDEVALTGWVHNAETGERLFGFGECKGVVVPLEP
ncbi:hypothetical protein IWX49DRAFT_364745 [Phyllosticta citricarpa]|uniref:Fumarylacetoacetase n=1 Tax=Phyllosticta paracitricarpa TaxID=2016321 RepID=A0ABR1NC98_9PEZI